MARRRRKKEAGLAGSLLLVALFLLLAHNGVGATFVAIFAVSWWLGFEVKTTCDVEGTKGTPCGNPAHGFLRACRHQPRHRQIKRAILLSYIRINGPIRRIMWARNPAAPSRAAGTNSAAMEPGLTHGTRESVTFACTVISACIGAAEFVVTVLAFAGLGAS